MFNKTVCSVIGGVSALAGSGVLSLCSQRSCSSCFGCVGVLASLGVALLAKKIIDKGQVKSETGNLEV
ncbi:hypothetical protein [Candidatus Magnetomonas plexicatena]|uniref:hypothetical protein n=1 Tax=Candidatus Magnetomonas plexicatena TaxID=2552947 RepID=UPI001C7633DA|nr:hypothetical protein E2O03_012305 [Nitrospirales bacterium LBB_01]